MLSKLGDQHTGADGDRAQLAAGTCLHTGTKGRAGLSQADLGQAQPVGQEGPARVAHQEAKEGTAQLGQAAARGAIATREATNV